MCINLLEMNLFSLVANIATLGSYFYLQKAQNLLIYNIWCLINAILFIIRGFMFSDYACCIAEIFWIVISVYGIMKIVKNKKDQAL